MITIWDGSSLAHRVYHSVRHFDANRNPCGIPVGFMKTAARICSELKEQFLEPATKIVCFDYGRCVWRSEKYPAYKANRTKPEVSDFRPQMEDLEGVVGQFGFLGCKAYGTEADDLIGVLANELEAQTDERIFIVSSDHDLWQLITDRVHIYDLSNNTIIDPATAQSLLGFPHTRLVEYKAIAGDSSDNIKGAKGIGDKGATQILLDHPDIQTLLADLEANPAIADKGVLKKLYESREDVKLAGQLCTITQFPEQLWSKEARDAVTGVVRDLLAGRLPTADETGISTFIDLWRLREPDWTAAFQ